MSSSDVKATSRMLRQIDDPNTRRLLELTLLNIDILKDSLSAVEDPDSFEWIDAVLENGWVQYSDDNNLPKYTKLSNGIVLLKGMISSGTTTAGTVLFTLPAGYRPDRISNYSTISGGAIASFDVLPTGDVVIGAGANTNFSLDGFIFEAER